MLSSKMFASNSFKYPLLFPFCCCRSAIPPSLRLYIRNTRSSYSLAHSSSRAPIGTRFKKAQSPCNSHQTSFRSSSSSFTASYYYSTFACHRRPSASSTSSSSRKLRRNQFFVPYLFPTQFAKLDSQIRNRTSSGSHKHDHDHDHHDHDHGHSHSHGLFGHHHHHHDTSFLTSKNKADAGVRITRIGLFVNVGMAISKGLGGWYFNSQALVADAVHALTDLVSDIMTLATVSWALKPPTEKFPNGFGKIESLGSLGVSSLLLFGGLAMCLNSCEHIYTQLFADSTYVHEIMEHLHIGHGHSHPHSHTDLGPHINAAWLAGGSIIVKEWLYRATMKIAKSRKSSVLASNAVHHRVDSLTAMVALVSITLSNIISNAQWLDPVGGFLVSLLVIHAGYGNSKSALMELADMAIDDETKLDIERVAEDALTAHRLATVEGSVSGKLASVCGTKSGQNYLVELVVHVEPGATVNDTLNIEKALRENIGSEVRGVKRVKVKFAPEGADTDEFVAKRKDTLEGEDLHSQSQQDGNTEKGK